MTFSRIVPQTVRFGVLSWKKGTRRAGWVAHASELGARGIGCVARGSELGARTARWTGWVATHKAPGPDRESARPDTESAGARHKERRARHRAPEPDTESPGPRPTQTQRAPGPQTGPDTNLHMAATPCFPRAPVSRTPHPMPCRVSPKAVMPIARLPCWSNFAQKQKLRKKSPLSPPIHAQISADLSTVQRSGGCVFLWRAIP